MYYQPHLQHDQSHFRSRLISITLIALSFISVSAGADERTIRVGGDHAYPPFEYLDESGQPAGFNIELAQALAKTMGFTLQIELSSWTEARARLHYGIVDMLAGMYRSPARQAAIGFSQPYYTTDYNLFARKDSGIKGIDDIRTLRIATQNGDLAHEFLVEAGLGSALLVLDDRVDLFRALIDGRADCAVFSASAGWLVLDDPAFSSIEAIQPPLFSAEYCVAVGKSNTALLAAVNEGLSILKANGEYDALYRRWFANSGKQAQNTSPGVIAALVMAVITVIAVALAQLKAARRPAQRSADELSAEQKRRAELDAQLRDALSVPATTQERQDESPEEEPFMRPLKASVIVAEDEAVNRLYLKRILEKAGYDVRVAADGQAALEAASEKNWDFILMDVSMPRMDGLEATRRIRAFEAERNTPRIPIIALTAHAYAEDREACAQAGMDGFLPKPFTEPALWAEVSRIAVDRAAGSQPGR
ncbi:MAG: hypothetical protein A2Y38_11270 [Spirochaetes bacterium GWB1_59_5]|nr:MAG: hypothetical protein A2Y38_11270 [Spirochaetes bacterium GWB1_59_5]